MATKKVLRLPDVIARVGLGKTSIYRSISDGNFPAPIALGSRAVAWRESDIDAWLAARPSARRPGRRPIRAPRHVEATP